MTEVNKTPFLRPEEEIIIMIHRHWIILVYKFLYILGLVFTTCMVMLFQKEIIYIIGDMFYWASLSIFWILFLTFIYLNWINDELDLFIITNARIIGIDQETSLSRTISECSLDRVQEVNAQTSGILQTLFSFGHLHIHTASEQSHMTVSYAPDPVENARKINNVIQQYRNSHMNQWTKPDNKTWV